MKKINLAIVGSRDITDYVIFWRYALGAFRMLGFGIADIEKITSGGADGVDEIAMDFATDHKIDFTMHIPEWKTIGVKDAFDRNAVIAEECDAALVLWDGDSNGTQNTINRLHDYEKPHILVTVLVRKDGRGKVIEQIPINIEFARPRGWRKLYEQTNRPDEIPKRPVRKGRKQSLASERSITHSPNKRKTGTSVRSESRRGESKRTTLQPNLDRGRNCRSKA